MGVLSRWHEAFVGKPPRIVIFPESVTYLEPARAYTPTELKEQIPKDHWTTLMRDIKGCSRNPKTVRCLRDLDVPPTNVVFVNPPLDYGVASGSHDLLGEAAYYSSIPQLPFQVGEGPAALVEYRWFLHSRQDLDQYTLPDSLRYFLYKKLLTMVGNLPAEAGAKAAGLTVQIARVPKEASTGVSIIWAETRSDPKLRIVVSPLLLRSIYLRMYTQCAPLKWKYEWPRESPYMERDGRYNIFLARNNRFTSCFDAFSDALTLPLAHELGHIVLAGEGDRLSDDERCADRFSVAYALAFARDSERALSTWQELLSAFDTPEGAQYWGFDVEHDITQRLAQIKMWRDEVAAGLAMKRQPPESIASALSCRSSGGSHSP